MQASGGRATTYDSKVFLYFVKEGGNYKVLDALDSFYVGPHFASGSKN